MSTIIEEIQKEYIKAETTEFNVGDTIKVFFKVVEGKKERLQPFEGVVTKIQNGGTSKSFTVRKVVQSIGVEKTFQFNSPRLAEVKVLRMGKVRKAKLLYLRDRVGAKANKIKAKDPRLN